MCLFEYQFLKQPRFCPGKGQCYHIPVFGTTFYKLCNQSRIIGWIAKHPSKPRLSQSIIFNRVVICCRRPWSVYRGAGIEIKITQFC